MENQFLQAQEFTQANDELHQEIFQTLPSDYSYVDGDTSLGLWNGQDDYDVSGHGCFDDQSPTQLSELQQNDAYGVGAPTPHTAAEKGKGRATLCHADYCRQIPPFQSLEDQGFNTGLEPASYNQFQPIPRQAMTSVTSARLGKSICHEYRYPPITETSMPSASDEELFQATSYSENTMTSADDALSPTTSGTVYIDPEVSLSLEAAGQYLQELNILEDGVKAVYVVVENHLFRIQNEQTTLWKKNPDLRRRGLRGGRARKQNATGKAFISITLEPPAEYKRRKEVETQDYQDRTRSSGLQNLADVFDNCYNLIHEQQRLAGLVLKHGNTLTSESAGLTELEDARTRYETAIGGIDREKMDEIQEMLDTFNAEFRCD